MLCLFLLDGKYYSFLIKKQVEKEKKRENNDCLIYGDN